MKPIKILLVEDDELDVLDIKRSLEKLSIVFQLETAKNGEEALEILNDKGSFGLKVLPHVVLIDINMPKMNGFELLEVIRSNSEYKDLKCFVITTSDEKIDRLKADALKVSGYIIKPLKLTSPSNMDTFNLMIDLMNFQNSEMNT